MEKQANKKKKTAFGEVQEWNRIALYSGCVAGAALLAAAFFLASFLGEGRASEEKVRQLRLEAMAVEVRQGPGSREGQEALQGEALQGEAQEALPGETQGALQGEAREALPGEAREASPGEAREALSEEGREALQGEAREALSGESQEPLHQGTEPGPQQPQNPYASLFAQNEDMAAWLVVGGTVVDYPVMQTMEDETYYLYRDFYGNDDKAGCLILDTDSPLEGDGTTNLIIHGHNMKAGTMFGGLDQYQDEEYGSSHRNMELYTRSEKRSYEVMAVFYSQVYYSTDIVFKYYNFFQAQNEEEFYYFYNNVKNMSLYDTGVTAKPGDRFLTLSTCAYHVEDGRFVVVAKEVGREEISSDGIVLMGE